MSNGWEKIKLKEEAISEILVADIDLGSGAEDSHIEEYFEEERCRCHHYRHRRRRRHRHQQQQQASAEVEPRAATSGGLPSWGPPQGTQIFILLSVQQKV
jgi:hypothetical protein